ncbi:RDD family protein [uncultured Tenacibaculum sp.]|uniref:RDD family protein n=1 Tax=uncultured Tenacibaculum sp. TaxID=174713 RepID=UPI00262B45F7|nr:cytochrome c oxidase assembly factor Coa1 family protein [uncultured Tenacibaculum sp.]
MNEELEQQLNLSSRKRRIAAFMIDHFVMTFLMVSIVFLALGPNFMDENNIGKMTSTMLAVMLPGFLLYFAKDSIKGISVGKWIMGIMVRDANNPYDIPSFGRLLVRNLFILIWPVEFIVLASSQEKKRLGDKTAKTIVVKNPNKPSKLPRILALAGVGIAFYTFTFLFVGSAMKNSDAYKVAVQEIEQNQEILDETGGIKGYGMMPTGSVNISNGNGQAQLEIKVLGNEKDLNISVYLTKEPNGEWKLIEMNK